MRIRTLLAVGVGAALGAGAIYLGDPDHGSERRVEARRWAVAQGRQQAAVAATSALRLARGYAAAALEGFHESRGEQVGTTR